MLYTGEYTPAKTEIQTSIAQIAANQKKAREHIAEIIGVIGPTEDRRVMFTILKRLEEAGRRHGKAIANAPEPKTFEELFRSGEPAPEKPFHRILNDTEALFTAHELLYFETIGAQLGWKGHKTKFDPRGDFMLEVVLCATETYGRYAGWVEARNPDIMIEPLFVLPERLLRTPLDSHDEGVSVMHTLRDEFDRFQHDFGVPRRAEDATPSEMPGRTGVQ